MKPLLIQTLSTHWKIPARAPTDPRLRQVYLRELRQAWLAGMLDLNIKPQLIPTGLLAELFSS